MKRSALTILLMFACAALAQRVPAAAPDLTKQPTLFVVPYAHLDTQWRWEYPTTISKYLPSTLHENFALFEKYPHYVFNFSGANRYRMIKEYYPADYVKMKQYVAAGRWFPSGSSMEENDVNSPSAESIMRQILYGTHFFRHELGKSSAEFMLPDCFGFPASLPSILAHMGVKGFSTQKLSWHSGVRVGGPGSAQDTPVGIPFNVGFWQGPDGRGVIAALNATNYDGDVTEDLTKSEKWIKRVQKNGESSRLFVDFRYYGTGDIGGSPREPSVRLMEGILTKTPTVIPPPRQRGRQVPPPPPGPPVLVGNGPLNVVQATAEQMFLAITPEQAARLPRYQGDLELVEHSAGSLTSQAYLKRWNRRNETLADAAERASVAAEWLGGRPYPLERLNNAWTLVTGGQFHDIIPGTSTPKAYEYAWNDQVLAMNQFAGVLTSATEAIASGLDTRGQGTTVVVYNPLSIPREDVVEARVAFPYGKPNAVRVIGPDGKAVPAQVSGDKFLFLAKVPPLGYAVYDVQPPRYEPKSTLKVTESSLENARYRVRLNQNGDISSIFDKKINRELLSGPARLALTTDRPADWPAWNMDWTDMQKPPRAYAQGPAKVRVVENGPVRVAVEVEREATGSKFVQTIRLASGEGGNRVELVNVIDWRTAATNLKAAFPLTASNPMATYNWDVGTIQRGNNDEKKFEVASHQWFDLTDKSGTYGVTVLTDAKNGSDKPDDNTVRLTLLRTPGIGTGNGWDYNDQQTQDWGHHEFVYGLAGHAGDWRQEQTDWQALRLNQPLIAFETSKHAGALGKTFSLLKVSNSRVRVMAVKKAEDSEEVIIRLVEVDGRPAEKVRIVFAAPLTAAREVNGQEQPIGAAEIADGELVTSFGPYQPRTFAVKLAASRVRLQAPQSQPVPLPYDRAVATADSAKPAGGFDDAGHSLPAEMLPHVLDYSGVQFRIARGDQPNAVVARGQRIPLPRGKFNRLYILAAADGDQNVTLRVGDQLSALVVQDWGGYVGQWDNRTFNKREEPIPPRPGAPPPDPWMKPGVRTIMEFAGLTPGFIKPAPVAWFASHHHNPDGSNEPYAYSYLFAYAIDVPPNAKTLTLPENDKVRILAITAATEEPQVQPAQPLLDTLETAPIKR